MEDIALKEYLKNKGMLLTRERASLLDKIVSQKKHFEAESCFNELRQSKIPISRPTYYRNLKLFLKAGILSKSNLEDGRVIYENRLRQSHHDHFICVGCGKIIEFSDIIIEKRQKQVCKKHKFTALRHQMQIFGLCRRCANGKRKKRIK
jgi:Fur family transcriptional regulator, ferric uptake regulator